MRAKPFDLEERTFNYAKDVIAFTKSCPGTMPNSELVRQLVRSSGSVGANYIEAREALSKKDFVMRVKICRKEAKESAYWLRLLEIRNDGMEQKRQALIDESSQLLKIFSSIVEKAKTQAEQP
jgi:four helix bundle protein